MTRETDPVAADLLTFIAASPTPEHCVAAAAERLRAAGFVALAEGDRWAPAAGAGYYVVRGGSIVAFRVGLEAPAIAGVRILGAHTDSPGFRLKPQADVRCWGYEQLAFEVYGGLLEYTWLDRDLGLAGRVCLRGEAGEPASSRLVRIDRPVLRIPSLAIHLQREIREKGLLLNRQTQLSPILGLDPAPGDPTIVSGLRRLLAAELAVDPTRILTWDLAPFDLTPPAVAGAWGELIASARLDNQAMCHAALAALLAARAAPATQVICLFDHEEVGSGSYSGADSSMAEELLRRLCEVEGPGAERGALPRALARSMQISADMAHAVHPNFADKHDPQHLPMLGKGPVIKVNNQQRYATTAEGAAIFAALCEDERVPYQAFVSRGDLACGTTIGPISAARLGVRTVDVGNPMLGMHSIRETASAEDPGRMVAVMRRFLEVSRLG